ncbi:MAG TPA: hypothetical protein VN578_18940 [Candidatus Binatia bacterium]|jgi:hypothetical protein|nr:hypothetical protein [Candidatus Binatia bacterium]
MQKTAANFRRLDPDKIIESVRALQTRIEERFPGSGLGRVVAELLEVAEEAIERTRWIQQPNLPLRTGAALLSLAVIVLLIGLLTHIRHFDFNEWANSMQGLDASISSMVFIGAAVLFFLGWENRIKRRRALKAVHELRALAHIVDMHQLTKDPERSIRPQPGAKLKRRMSPFELARYLDYCSDALALISKVAALYAQGFQDEVLLDAVDDVEDLTAGFSRKIWQKITIIENMSRSLPEGDSGDTQTIPRTQPA